MITDLREAKSIITSFFNCSNDSLKQVMKMALSRQTVCECDGRS